MFVHGYEFGVSVVEVILTDLLVEHVLKMGNFTGHLSVLLLDPLAQFKQVGPDVLLLIDRHSDFRVDLDFCGETELPEERLLEIGGFAELLLAVCIYLDNVRLPLSNHHLEHLFIHARFLGNLFIVLLCFVELLKLNFKFLRCEAKGLRRR